MSKIKTQASTDDVPTEHVRKESHPTRFRRAGAFVFVSCAPSHLKPGSRSPATQVGIRKQTVSCIEELRAVLQEAGGGLENLVEVTTYLANMNDYGGYNDIYSKHFTSDGPARTTVAVHQLSHPDGLIEIRGTAYIAQDPRIIELND